MQRGLRPPWPCVPLPGAPRGDIVLGWSWRREEPGMTRWVWAARPAGCRQTCGSPRAATSRSPELRRVGVQPPSHGEGELPGRVAVSMRCLLLVTPVCVCIHTHIQVYVGIGIHLPGREGCMVQPSAERPEVLWFARSNAGGNLGFCFGTLLGCYHFIIPFLVFWKQGCLNTKKSETRCSKLCYNKTWITLVQT